MILTHFSINVEKIAQITDKHLETKTLVAFDHMRMPLSYLEWAYKINKLYKHLLENEKKDLEFKIERYEKA